MKVLLPLTAAAVLAAIIPTVSQAQDKVTVESLAGDGYAVVSSFMTNIGPALLLQKAGNLYFCFVTETPDNPVITTNYCKPVR